MHVIVAGCGRVGAALSGSLDADDADVVVIDRDPEAFRRLPESYRGRRLRGIVFDRETLEEAGVAHADAVVGVTSGDNSNIVVARTAHESYGVEVAVARIYDPERAAIYERFGIVTVASARWTVDEIRRVLLPPERTFEAALGAGAGEVVVVALIVPAGAASVPVDLLARPGRWTVAAVTRQGRTAVPTPDSVVRAGDELHCSVDRSGIEELRDLVAGLGSEV